MYSFIINFFRLSTVIILLQFAIVGNVAGKDSLKSQLVKSDIEFNAQNYYQALKLYKDTYKKYSRRIKNIDNYQSDKYIKNFRYMMRAKERTGDCYVRLGFKEKAIDIYISCLEDLEVFKENAQINNTRWLYDYYFETKYRINSKLNRKVKPQRYKEIKNKIYGDKSDREIFEDESVTIEKKYKKKEPVEEEEKPFDNPLRFGLMLGPNFAYSTDNNTGTRLTYSVEGVIEYRFGRFFSLMGGFGYINKGFDDLYGVVKNDFLRILMLGTLNLPFNISGERITPRFMTGLSWDINLSSEYESRLTGETYAFDYGMETWNLSFTIGTGVAYGLPTGELTLDFFANYSINDGMKSIKTKYFIINEARTGEFSILFGYRITFDEISDL